MFGLTTLASKVLYSAMASLAVLSIIYVGYSHYTGILEQVNVLRESNAKLLISKQLQDTTISAQRQAISEWSKAQAALLETVEESVRVNEEATAETRKLNEIFAKHDLADLSKRKPGLIENRINAGTRRAGKLLEQASGSPKR